MIEYRVIKLRKDGSYQVQTREKYFFIFCTNWKIINNKTNGIGFATIEDAALYAIQDKARIKKFQEQKLAQSKYVPEVVNLKI
jgi:hypothetical protein